MVAAAWHQIGMVHEEAGQFEASEAGVSPIAGNQVRENDLPAQADTLNRLGNLYSRMGRAGGSGDVLQAGSRNPREVRRTSPEKGGARNNLAITLIKLQRYDEARQELQRAIE